MKKLLFITALCLVLLPIPNLAETEIAKLRSAVRVAKKVFEETQDAQGAIAVLNEAGVARIIKKRPQNLTDSEYLNLLSSYANLLAQWPGQELQAAKTLKRAIELDRNEPSAYLSLGDVYTRLYQQNNEPRYRSIANSAYKKYLTKLRLSNQNTLIPQNAVDANYGAPKDICSLVSTLMGNNKLADLTMFFNAETEVKLLNKTEEGNIIDGESGTSFAGLVENVNGQIRRSLVDVDNDGKPEIHYSAMVNTINCERHLFYKNFNNGRALYTNDILELYYKTGHICGDSYLNIIRFNKQNYLVETLISAQVVLNIHHLSPSGNSSTLCSVTPPTPLQLNVISNCNAVICNKLIKNIDQIISSEAQQGVEQLITDITTLNYTPEILDEVEYSSFIRSQHQYQADIDNDGKMELLARFWKPLPDGRTFYRYRLFKENEDLQWQPWSIPTSSTNQPDRVLDDKTWFFIEQDGAKNYLVTYTSTTTPKANTEYLLSVFLLENDILKHVGDIQTAN